MHIICLSIRAVLRIVMMIDMVLVVLLVLLKYKIMTTVVDVTALLLRLL